MTAEVVIKNREAIALAADSAATIIKAGDKPGDEKNKIFTSVNKIFSLSKYHPIGIMIYNDAYFMGIPWETIIKSYRDQLRDKSFKTVKESASDFFAYLKNKKSYFPEEKQIDYYKYNIYMLYNIIFYSIKNKINDIIKNEGSIKDNKISEVVKNSIDSFYEIHKNEDYLSYYNKEIEEEFSVKFKKHIIKAKTNLFKKLPLSSSDSRKLTKIAVEYHFKNEFYRSSGLVFAGFGEEEHFPTLISYTLEGIANDILKCHQDCCYEDDTKTLIKAFAQGEMVHTFMEGVDHNYQEYIISSCDSLMKKLLTEIINTLCIEKVHANKCHSVMSELRKKLISKMTTDLKKYREKEFIEPILSVVDNAPKNEIAEMAESLVNLTSFKKRVSLDIETVGGPIDVAVISKGDGLIWIKRKHYFDPELNFHFFSNYFREGFNNEASKNAK